MSLIIRISALVFVIGILFVAFSAWKEMERSKRIEGEVEKLRSEANRIQGENQTLVEKIAYFSTEDFEEREAKDKLGMKKKDEEVVSIDTGAGGKERSSENPEDQKEEEKEDIPNYVLWLKVFTDESFSKN